MFGKINWEVAIDTALGTIADREDEMRKASAEVLRTVHKDRLDQVAGVREENKELRKEIDRKVGLLRSEGLTDDMISSAIDAFGSDAFTVIGKNIEEFKKNDRESYNYLKQKGLLAEVYKKEFDRLLEQAGDGVTRDIDLDTAKATLLKELPELTMPEVTESQFGFQYSRKLRDQIAQAGSDISDVPEYDRGAPVSGLSELFTGLTGEVPSAADYSTPDKLKKAIQLKLLGTYGSLKKASLSDVFETSATADAKEKEFVASINSLVDSITNEFLSQRREIAPGELAGKVEGALTDPELLEQIFSTTQFPTEPEGSVGAVSTVATTNQSIANFLNNNTGTPTADLVTEIQQIPNVTDQQVQDILRAVAGGTPFGTAIGNAGLDPNDPIFSSGSPMMIRIGKALQGANFNLINSQIFGATPAPSSSQASVSGPKQPSGFAGGPKAKAWNDVYSAYFNPDGSVIDTQTYDTPQKIQDLLDKLNAEFKQKYPNMTL
jgi:hypothetical protein